MLTAPRGIGARALTERSRVREIAAQVVADVLQVKGDDANVRRVDLVTAYLARLMDAAADRAIERLTCKLTEDERAELLRRVAAERIGDKLDR
jgi:hypothetical protein